ncbi:nucleoside 2-deoxyribosyltransferase [Clostridium botulinum]|uniref:nucleoside 2-deoxyribosyltransferase n=1 Tax=Clostridium botulinum TaxID=1491 RepID=UPI00192A3D00|nr:nucleoside 2-deoxyribosyltransferase [Clostridium botulinum]
MKNFNKRVKEFIQEHRLQEVIDNYDFKHKAKVYIASEGLFSELDQIGLELIADICEQINLDYYLPQHADFNKKDTEDFTITGGMIAEGDNSQLRTCNFVLAHLKLPLDEGVGGEISRFKTMIEYEPNKYKGIVGWADDIRFKSKPNINQSSFTNQVGYLNQYCQGEIENSLGCYEKLGDCFIKIWEVFKDSIESEE